MMLHETKKRETISNDNVVLNFSLIDTVFIQMYRTIYLHSLTYSIMLNSDTLLKLQKFHNPFL